MIPLALSARTRKILAVAALTALFLFLRLPGIHLPYHQDEWKNVSSSATVETAGGFFAHPPFMQMLFVADYKLFGIDGFRILPLLFSAGAGVLLYFVVRHRAGRGAAMWSVLLFATCFYNIFGSLQADVDGSILPFFFLLAVFAYDRLRGLWSPVSWKWLALLAAALLAGFLVKLSFILVVGAIVLDYLWNNRHNKLVKKGILSGLGMGLFGAVYIGLLYLIQRVYPAFSIHFMLTHANQFTDGGRNWMQIAVQGVKALYYLSPLMLVPLLWSDCESVKKTLVFWLYLLAGGAFYFVLFDFSRGALDKYLMFAIVPLAAIVGVILDQEFKRRRGETYSASPRPASASADAAPQSQTPSRLPNVAPILNISLLGGLVVSILLVALNFLPQTVAALYPKTEWFGRVLHGHWNILTPLTGGSGPMGFYVSFLFIAASFIVCVVIAAGALFHKTWRAPAAIILVLIGLTYNAVFAEELFHGKLNGSSQAVLADAAAFIRDSNQVKQVMSYNDIGSETLSRMGKYAGRFYATPDFEEGHREKFAAYSGHYLVVDVPHLYESGFYGEFFAKCKSIFQTRSGRITGTVYECPKGSAMMGAR